MANVAKNNTQGKSVTQSNCNIFEGYWTCTWVQ